VKRQKKCNFCGENLKNPKMFNFVRKCGHCAQKNSNFIFPAALACSFCTAEAESDMFEWTEAKESVRTAGEANVFRGSKVLS